jgi:signal transduction histidine kinase
MEFVATVSHELRTPLAAIRSAGDNLADGLVHDPRQVERYGAIVRDEGLRLSEMVEQTLGFAGADAPAREAGAVDLAALVERVTAPVPGGPPFRVERLLAASLPPVIGDAAALERALGNLVGNARKHAAAGGGARVSVRPGPGSPPRTVVVEVADQGPGVEPAERARLFEPFFRGRLAREGQVPGSGLGLALVRRIVEGHGGSVTVASPPGQGTTFTVTLPAGGPAESLLPDAPAHPAR